MKVRLITSSEQNAHANARVKCESLTAGKVHNPLPTQTIGLPSDARVKTKLL